jgi:predicted metal-dependent phosphoesterase TrpH
MKYDFHTHSKYSLDGYVKPKDLVRAAGKAGLSGIAVTDHNTIKGGIEAKEYETEDLEVIVGSEILTDIGEVIGLFLEEEITSYNFYDVVNDIKSQNGVVVLPHPFDGVRSTSVHPGPELAGFIDNVEVFNSRCVRSSYNDLALSYANENHLNIIAGSDAHFENEVGNAGVKTESDNIEEAVINGDFTVFGQRSNIINPVTTKLLKMWRG